MRAVLLIGVGLVLVVYSCFVAASDDDDQHGRD